MATGPTCCRQFATEPVVDYYAVLGVKPGASAKVFSICLKKSFSLSGVRKVLFAIEEKVFGVLRKVVQEIKAAFYSLSKKYHPDRNRDNQAEAASKFHQVSLAYEVLGSDEKRKMYDMTRIRTSPDLSSHYVRRTTTSAPTKQYTDLDIDYKSFEHFQRLNRQRKTYHSRFDMPEEFYAELGGKRREFKSTYEPPAVRMTVLICDGLKLFEFFKLETERQQAKYPIPTFEQMMREKRRKQEEENRKQVAGALGLATAAAAIIFIVRKFFR
ncbi:unnamed protein product [Haemonchus placei]|uniref:J domain-containing protein n=1 Tax=Haemonchus placei TaxID=6290 RepID=A0A0N4WSK4_HAEPC|nr:unnamed protein product [Haemonchus placei]